MRVYDCNLNVTLVIFVIFCLFLDSDLSTYDLGFFSSRKCSLHMTCRQIDRHGKIGFCFVDFKRINFDNQKFDGTKYVWFPKRKVIIISFVENVSFYLVSFWMFYDLTVRAIHRNCLSKATPSPPFRFSYSYPFFQR